MRSLSAFYFSRRLFKALSTTLVRSMGTSGRVLGSTFSFRVYTCSQRLPMISPDFFILAYGGHPFGNSHSDMVLKTLKMDF